MSSETLHVVLRHRELQAGQVLVLELADAAGQALPPFEAGAHIDLHLPGGLLRPYSLCGDPREPGRYRLGVLRDPASRGGSVAVHEQLSEGQALTISRPRNHFPLQAGAAHSVLAGGGIGITPMIAMAWALHARGASFELHYCARSRSQCAFLDELAQAPWADRVRLHFDDAEPAQRLQPAALLAGAVAGTHLYVCGPTGFMDWVMAEARSAGLAEAQIHREYFGAAVPAHAVGDAPFELVAQRSGKTVTVAPGQSMAEALRTVGVRLNLSCEQGVCGTCACDVLDGEPDHRDAYFTDDEKAANDQVLVCCSRARSSRLVLDL